MRSVCKWLLLAYVVFSASVANAHGEATYLGNSSIVVTHGDHKIMFDPFFHNDFGIYQLVPEELHQSVMAGTEPYDGIDAIFISHAHEDHFDVEDVIEYLTTHQTVKLFGPQQAIDQITKVNNDPTVNERLVGISLDFGQTPISMEQSSIRIDAVRIPHAGWPQRRDVENLVFRITLDNQSTVMHMGDADPDDDHYLPLKSHWEKQRTDINFPPYWFLLSAEGNDILQHILNAERHVGVHVPIDIPNYLKKSGKQYFHKPGTKVSLE